MLMLINQSFLILQFYGTAHIDARDPFPLSLHLSSFFFSKNNFFVSLHKKESLANTALICMFCTKG